MKPPKKEQPKKTFAAEMGNRIKQLSDARFEKKLAEERQRFKQQEDEMMEMMHGPNWRERYAGESEPSPKASAEEDFLDSEYYDDPRRHRQAS